MAKVSVLGAGSWGSALAVLLNDNKHDVTMWSVIEEEVKMLNENREHKDKLPGVHLDEKIKITTDLEEAVKGMEMIIFAVPSVFTRNTAKMAAPFISDDQIIINVAKGIEEATLFTLSEIIEEEIPNAIVGVLSGPSHAEEVGRRLPTTCVVGAKDKKIADFVQGLLMNEVFRVYTSPDILGIEVGAALKNVIALAAGIADGLGYGDNTKAALITRGMAEITRLGMAMGGKPETFSGLSGMGDLIVTCASLHSRNRRAGILIGKGYSMEEACKEVKMIVEGVNSAKAAKKLADKFRVSMPIVDEVNKVLFEEKSAKDAVRDLMIRNKRDEDSRLVWE